MVKAEVYRDGKYQGSVKGRLLIAMTATANEDGSMDGDCAICGKGNASDVLWMLDKLTAAVAQQLNMSMIEVLSLIMLCNSTDEEQADE